MTIEYGANIPKKNYPKSPESLAVLKFMDSDENAMAIHFDDLKETLRNVKKIHKFKNSWGFNIRIIRRGTTVFVIKEDLDG